MTRSTSWCAGAGSGCGSIPEKELISRRYLRYGGPARDALARLADEGADGASADVDLVDAEQDKAEARVERPISLNQQRLDAVVEAVRSAVRSASATGGRVVDLGCGEGRLLQELLNEPQVTHLLGVDVSAGALERAARRLRIDDLSERRQERVALVQGALTYLDERIKGHDVATLIEVIEQIDPPRLEVLAQVLFGNAARAQSSSPPPTGSTTPTSKAWSPGHCATAIIVSNGPGTSWASGRPPSLSSTATRWSCRVSAQAIR